MKQRNGNSDYFAVRGQSGSYETIWRVVGLIPEGKVASYGQIAILCRKPGQARLVGYALRNTPPGFDIPWHRVINAQGRISFASGSLQHKNQKELLQREGIAFTNGKIDFRRYGWKRMVR